MIASKCSKTLVAAGFVLAAFGAHAAGGVTVTVTANVVNGGLCKFSTASPVVRIANSGTNIDPSLATTATGNANITYRCSTGTTPGFSMPATATITNGASSMVATISSTNGGPGTGMGAAQAKLLNVVGQIARAGFENAAVGAYTGTMVVSVSP